MDDAVVWKFQSLYGDSGVKYGVSSCFELCYYILCGNIVSVSRKFVFEDLDT